MKLQKKKTFTADMSTQKRIEIFGIPLLKKRKMTIK